MLVIGGDQATILGHLQAGGVRDAEPFMGATIVPVDQAALAQQVLSRPLAAPSGPQRASSLGAHPQPTEVQRQQPAAIPQQAPSQRVPAHHAQGTARQPMQRMQARFSRCRSWRCSATAH
jgi:hypothetical protein